MANHLRRQIRDAIVTAVTGLTTTGSRVYAGRVYGLQNTELPCLRVYSADEEDAIFSLGVNRRIERKLDMVIEAVFKDTTSLDDKGDLILKEVEIALGPGAALGGGKYAHLARVEMERDGDGDQPAALMRMTFQIPYYTAHGVPDVAL